MYSDFRKIYQAFESRSVDDPLFETLRLIDVLTGGMVSRINLSFVEAFLSEKGMSLDEVASKRQKGIPLEYILERATFAGLRLHCSKDTLIPTDWTHLLVGVVLDFVRRRQKDEPEQTIVEVGTGCGNIAVALGISTDNTKILASDISEKAIEVARKNVEKYGLQERVSLCCGDLFYPFEALGLNGDVDIVVSNPPYIPTRSLEKLPEEVINHEPIVSLDGGPYGMDFYRRLISEAVSVLKPNGVLVFEIGAGQEKLVKRLLEKNGNYQDIEFFRDGECVRVMSATRSSNGHGRGGSL